MNQTVPGGRSYDVINGLIGTTNSMHAGSHICTSQQLQPPVAAQLTEAGARLINDINAAALEAIDTLPTPKDDPCPALPILPSSWMQFIKAGSSGQKSTPKTACNPLATIIADFLMTKPGTRPRRRGEEYTPEELREWLYPDPNGYPIPEDPPDLEKKKMNRYIFFQTKGAKEHFGGSVADVTPIISACWSRLPEEIKLQWQQARDLYYGTCHSVHDPIQQASIRDTARSFHLGSHGSRTERSTRHNPSNKHLQSVRPARACVSPTPSQPPNLNHQEASHRLVTLCHRGPGPLPPDPFSHNAPAAPVPVMLSSAMDGQYVNQPLDVFSGESHLWFQSPPPLFAHAMSTLSHNQFNMDQGIPYFWENRTEPSSSISAGSDSNESAYRDTSDFIVHDPGDMLCWQ